MFGADDADWEAYRKIVSPFMFGRACVDRRMQNLQVASSDEEDELQQLQEIEEKLLAHDPTFTVENTHAVMASQRSALLTAFKPDYDESDFAGETTRLHLLWRWR
jgi:actin-related protein 5